MLRYNYLFSANTSNLGLSNGGIAGVVIACLVVIVLIAFALIYLKRSGKINPPVLKESLGSGFDNALYSKTNDDVKIDSDA